MSANRSSLEDLPQHTAEDRFLELGDALENLDDTEQDQDEAADEDGEASATKDDDSGLRLMIKDKPRAPYKWTITHQLVWMKEMGRTLPTNFFSWAETPLESVATPINVDLSVLTIELTAKEILTFFPSHFVIPEIQDRFNRNGIKGTFQAMFINMQRTLRTPYIVMPRQVRAQIKHAVKVYGKTDAAGPCMTFTTRHYTFACAQEDKIPYPLINCGDGIHPSDFPQGADAGPFTKALIKAQVMAHNEVTVQELDTYLALVGIDRGLEQGYSDQDFYQRHVDSVRKYQQELRVEADTKGYKWET